MVRETGQARNSGWKNDIGNDRDRKAFAVWGTLHLSYRSVATLRCAQTPNPSFTTIDSSLLFVKMNTVIFAGNSHFYRTL